MSDSSSSNSPIVVVTGANGLVGSRICQTLSDSGATVRAVVRRAGAAPSLPGVVEHVGDFHDPDLAAAVVDGATGVITTVHPLGADRETQQRVAVEGTPVLARAARDGGVDRLVHISTTSVYERSPEIGDIAEDGELVGDDAGAYSTTKRDTDAALAEINGLTRVLVRPPAILGSGETSIWNSVQPKEIRDKEEHRHAVPHQTFAWVHVDDLARFASDLATGAIDTADDPEQGPVSGQCTVVNVAAPPATTADYHRAVTSEVGVEPIWDDEEVWTGQIVADRARRWGWAPTVDLSDALEELREGLTDAG